MPSTASLGSEDMEMEFERVMERFDKSAKSSGENSQAKQDKAEVQNANESGEQTGSLRSERSQNKWMNSLRVYFMQVIEPHSTKISINLSLIEKITKLLYTNVSSSSYSPKKCFGFWKTFIERLSNIQLINTNSEAIYMFIPLSSSFSLCVGQHNQNSSQVES